MNQDGVNFVVAVVTVILSATVGGGTVLVLLNRLLKNIRNDQVVLSALQHLASSYPPEVRELLFNSGSILQAASGQASNLLPPASSGTPVSKSTGVDGKG